MKPVRQIPEEPYRRCFFDSFFNLTVWHTADGSIAGFQLCYGKGQHKKALTWLPDSGFSHDRVDDGEGIPGHYKMAPILVPDGLFDKDNILTVFKEESREIDSTVVDFVCGKIAEYPTIGTGSYQHP